MGIMATFHQKIAEVSLRKYRELPKKGKPKKDEEWSPLATVVSATGTYVHTWLLPIGS